MAGVCFEPPERTFCDLLRVIRSGGSPSLNPGHPLDSICVDPCASVAKWGIGAGRRRRVTRGRMNRVRRVGGWLGFRGIAWSLALTDFDHGDAAAVEVSDAVDGDEGLPLVELAGLEHWGLDELVADQLVFIELVEGRLE